MIQDQLIINYVQKLNKGGDNMDKVYIVNRSIHDYSAAKKFGELIFHQKKICQNSQQVKHIGNSGRC